MGHKYIKGARKYVFKYVEYEEIVEVLKNAQIGDQIIVQIKGNYFNPFFCFGNLHVLNFILLHDLQPLTKEWKVEIISYFRNIINLESGVFSFTVTGNLNDINVSEEVKNAVSIIIDICNVNN